MKRREVKDDAKRAAELAAYFTHAKLQPYHTALALRSAMVIFAKLKNYNSCATFCRRMLELNSTQKVCNTYCVFAGTGFIMPYTAHVEMTHTGIVKCIKM